MPLVPETSRRAKSDRAFRYARCLLLALMCMFAAAGCAPAVPRLGAQVQCPPNSAVLFLVDGLDRTRLTEMVEAGELPHIKRLFVDGGVRVRDAVASLPPITYPNCVSLITGAFPGHHGIVGNYWFDRYSLQNHYYMRLDTYRTVNQHFFLPTLYDVLDDQFTVNIQNHTRRGVTHTIDNKRTFAWKWFRGEYSEADYHVGDSIDEVIDAANQVGRWPRVLMTYYPGVDEIGHRHGAISDEYADALRNVDQVIGRVTREIEEAGVVGDIYYGLVADHSHCPIRPDQHVDMLRWIEEQRGETVWSDLLQRPHAYPERWRKFARYSAVVAVEAARLVMVQLRGDSGWSSRRSESQLSAWITRRPSLLDLSAVELVMIRAGTDRVRLMSRGGSGVIERRWIAGVKEYRLTEQQGDVLRSGERTGFADFVRQGWHDSRTWLRESAVEAYPDLVPQAVELFDSPRTGDVVILAAGEWGFAFGPAEHGGHGSCLSRDMHIPMMFAGPDLAHGAVVPCARLVDVMPTVLGLLGEAERLARHPAIDGVDLAEELRRAR